MVAPPLQVHCCAACCVLVVHCYLQLQVKDNVAFPEIIKQEEAWTTWVGAHGPTWVGALTDQPVSIVHADRWLSHSNVGRLGFGACFHVGAFLAHCHFNC